MKIPSMLAAAFIGVSVLSAQTTARASLLSYYIGIDDLPTIASGTYAGLANPNFNHLTFLYAHTYSDTPASNHYHSKSIYTYTGPNLGANTAIINSASNYVPEGALPPIKLSLGTGLYGDKLISNPYVDSTDPVYHFSFLEIGSTQSLAGFAPGSGESVLFGSSSGRWNSAYPLAHLHIELVSLTPGLNFGDATTLHVLSNPGDELHLTDPGAENDSWGFTPVLWTDAHAAPGIYEAKFRFFDEDGTYGDSGVVTLRTEVVPEPGTALLLLVGGAWLGARRRRAAMA